MLSPSLQGRIHGVPRQTPPGPGLVRCELAGGVANKEKGNSELTGSGDGTLNFNGWSVIATHHIDGNSHGILNGSNRQLTG